MALPRIAAGSSTRKKPLDLKAAAQSAASKAQARRIFAGSPDGIGGGGRVPGSGAGAVPRIGAGGRVSGGGYNGLTPAQMSYDPRNLSGGGPVGGDPRSLSGPGAGVPQMPAPAGAPMMGGGLPPAGGGYAPTAIPAFNGQYDYGTTPMTGIASNMSHPSLLETVYEAPWALIPHATGIQPGTAGYGLLRDLPVDPQALSTLMMQATPGWTGDPGQQANFLSGLYQGLNTPGQGLSAGTLLNQLFNAPAGSPLAEAMSAMSPANAAQYMNSMLNQISGLMGPMMADMFMASAQNNMDRYLSGALTTPAGQLAPINQFLAGRLFGAGR